MRAPYRNRHAMVFAEWFGVTWGAGLVLAALYEADTRPATVLTLSARLHLSEDATRTALARLLDALEPGDVIQDGERWAITEGGMDECNLALTDDKRRRRAA